MISQEACDRVVNSLDNTCYVLRAYPYMTPSLEMDVNSIFDLVSIMFLNGHKPGYLISEV